MDRAIDRRSSGIEKEIHISDFQGWDKSNLFCPECGELVFPKLGDKNIHHFSHKKKTEISIECDKRAKENSSKTFYEKTGLPIYLINESNQFSLHIGFYPLDKSTLDLAQKNNLKVIVSSVSSSGSISDQHLIDYTFYEDDLTLRPLNHLSFGNNNYKIGFSDCNSSVLRKITKKWSDYSDGFSNYGAIFFYSEKRGKKIRKDDTITTNKEYYLMTFYSQFKTVDGMLSTYCGVFNIGNTKAYIYKIEIAPSCDNDFRQLESYFWNRYKLRLLYSKPEIVQLWPPAIKSDDLNYTLNLKSKTSIFCKVNSSFEVPMVYRYIDEKYIDVGIHNDEYKNKYVKLPLYNDLTPISVDRKYLANAQMITANRYIYTSNKPSIMINDMQLLENNSINVYEKLFLETNTVNIGSNLNLQVVQVLENCACLKSIIADDIYKSVDIDPLVLYLLVYLDHIDEFALMYQKYKTTVINNDIENLDILLIKKGLISECIDISLKYKSIHIKLKNYPQIKKIVKPFLMEGKIPINVLNALVRGGLFDE